MHYMTVKLSDFVTCPYFKDSAFTAVKRDAKFQTRHVKGVPLPIEGVPFLSKMEYKMVRGWTPGRSLPI